jgi:hypothetical protein
MLVRYHFRQPERLSHLKLPFKILLVTALDAHAIREVAVDALAAADSWFLGYTWTLLFCSPAHADGCDGETHLGWRYKSASGNVFDALIVKYDEEACAGVGVSALPVVVPSSLRVGVARSSSSLAM